MRYSQSEYEIEVVNELMQRIDNHDIIDDWVDQTMIVRRTRDLEFALRAILEIIDKPANSREATIRNIIMNSKANTPEQTP